MKNRRFNQNVVTLLAILGSHAVAVPLSPTFPAHELRYILDQSQSLMLLSSDKFQDKADEILKEGLETQPINYKPDKILAGNTIETVTLENPISSNGGMMLYTSGTTSRPVCIEPQSLISLPNSVLTARRKVSFFHNPYLLHSHYHCLKHGTTDLQTACYMSFLFITSTAQ